MGSWKVDYANDTSAILDYKPYGTGMECNFRFVTKGKTVMEGKQLLGYDKNVDKFIISDMIKGTDIKIYGNWFISDNKYVFVPYSDISDSEKASFRADGEFKSPDLFIENYSVNNKPWKTFSFTRITQTTQSTLNQTELAKQFLGTWQSNIGKDTVEVWESQLYGNAVITNVSQIIKGKKSPSYMNNIGFDTKEGKLKGFIINPDGSYTTWIGLFSAGNNFSGDLVDSFIPEKAWAKFEFVFANPKEWTLTIHNIDGVKTSENKFSKVK
ncbi:MAG: hypothetical protein EPN88_02585 [Bacteroidetes bacterium]|nr:MAG: hypothetical protein EPN88_02585 [Bacteroidota bacterium]